MRKIRIGQIGIGHNHASEKMAALRRLSDFYEVVGVVEEDDSWWSRRGGLQVYQGIPRLTEEELFNTPGLEAVAVETDGFELLETARRCVERNLAIHMDKPGGEKLEPFRELLNEFRRKHLTIQLGYMYRNNPAVQYCLEAVRKGWLGEIFEVHAVMNRYDGHDEAYRRWLAQFQGGAVYIFAGHMIDLVVALLGRPLRVTPYLTKTRDDNLYDTGLAVRNLQRRIADFSCLFAEDGAQKAFFCGQFCCTGSQSYSCQGQISRHIVVGERGNDRFGGSNSRLNANATGSCGKVTEQGNDHIAIQRFIYIGSTVNRMQRVTDEIMPVDPCLACAECDG